LYSCQEFFNPSVFSQVAVCSEKSNKLLEICRA